MTNTDQGADASTPAAPKRVARIGAVASLLMLFLYSGYCLQALPVVAPAVLKDWNEPASSLSVPLALLSVGTALGSVLGGFLADVRGRKMPIVGFAVLQGIAMLLSAFAQTPRGFYPLMFTVGLTLGGYFSSGLALLTELAGERRRGLLVSMAMLVTPLGLSLCSLIAGFAAQAYGWPFIFLLGAGLCVPLVLGLTLCVPESPKYLARFPERSDAHRKVLARLGLAHEEEHAPDAAAETRTSAMSTLFTERLAVSLVLWLLFFVMYVLGSIVLNWAPVAFASLKFDIGFASRTLFYWTLGTMSGTLLSGWCMVRLGARNTATLFALATVVVLAALTFIRIGPSVEALVIALLVAAGFSVAGIVTTLYTLAAEIYPTATRATGIGIADAVGRVGGIVSAFVGVAILDRAGVSGFFGSILCLAIVTLAILVYFRRHAAP